MNCASPPSRVLREASSSERSTSRLRSAFDSDSS
jgi:hypothetical protein